MDCTVCEQLPVDSILLVLLGEEEVCTPSQLSTAEEISLYVYTIAYTNWPPVEVTQNYP